jgi:hypothetical protein
VLTTRYPLYPQKLALISPTSDGRSVGIGGLRAEVHGVLFFCSLSRACGIFERLWHFYYSSVGTEVKVIIQVYPLKMEGTTGGLGLRLHYRLSDKLLQPSSFSNKGWKECTWN